MKKYQEKVYHFVRRMLVIHEDADDVVQNVFIKIWNNLDKFREDSQLYTWIYRISVNESVTFLKSKQLKSFISFGDYPAEQIKALNDDNYFSGDEIEKKLQQALVKLPHQQRTVFNLRYFDELTYEQISEILGVTTGALKASYHIAVKKIEKQIKQN
jgi:RNA polymerase sigma factor (sigma-70 family)